MLMRIITLRRIGCLLLSLSFFSFAICGELELFYQIDGKMYSVSSFKDGLPDLEEIADEESSKALRSKGRDWKYEGNLSISPDVAWPVPFYRIERTGSRYGEFDTARAAHARFTFPKIPEQYPWNWIDTKTGLMVIGWVVDNKVSRICVMSLEAKPSYEGGLAIRLNESELDGYPLMWLSRNGKILNKNQVLGYEKLVFGTAAPEKATRKEMRSKDYNGNTALHYAAINGDVVLVEKLLSRKAGLLVENDDDEIPLVLAARAGRSDLCALLMDGPMSLKAKSNARSMAVRAAAENGHVNIVKTLAPSRLKKGKANVEHSGALLESIQNGYEEQTLYLLQIGSSLRMTVESQVSLIFSAFANRFAGIGKLLIEHLEIDPAARVEGITFMHAVAPYADVDLLEEMKQIGVPVDGISDSGLNPFDVAVGSGNINGLCWFLDHGGTKSGVQSNIDPIMHAVIGKQSSSVQCLIDLGRDVNLESEEGMTPLMQAALIGEREIAELLVEAGGAWNMSSLNIDTCIAAALECDSPLVNQSLFEQGLKEDYLLFGTWALSEICHFYGSDNMLKMLGDLPRNLARKTVPERELDSDIALIGSASVDYPIKLQRKYGDFTVSLRALVSPNGDACIVNLNGEYPEEIVPIVKKKARTLKFERPTSNGTGVPALVEFNLSLEIEVSLDAVFEIGELHKPPRAIRQDEPEIPIRFTSTPTSGWVDLEWTVTPEGSAIDIKVISSSHHAFVNPSIDSIRNSRWEPGYINGKAVNTRISQRYVFGYERTDRVERKALPYIRQL